MKKLIDYQAAIDALFDWEMTYDWDDRFREVDPKPEYIVSPSDVIKKLPTAESKRMRAKWIATTALQEGQITWRDYKCSNCSHHRGKPMNYCEVCGAKMER